MAFWDTIDAVDEEQEIPVTKKKKKKKKTVKTVTPVDKENDLTATMRGSMDSLMGESEKLTTGSTAPELSSTKRLVDKVFDDLDTDFKDRLILLEKRLDAREKLKETEPSVKAIKRKIKIPTFDAFVKFCQTHPERRTCNYFKKRFAMKRRPDDSSIRKVLDIIHQMNEKEVKKEKEKEKDTGEKNNEDKLSRN